MRRGLRKVWKGVRKVERRLGEDVLGERKGVISKKDVDGEVKTGKIERRRIHINCAMKQISTLA